MVYQNKSVLKIEILVYIIRNFHNAINKILNLHFFYSSAQLAACSRADQRASCVGIEGSTRTSKKPPPLLRSRTLPAIIVPGVNILQAQLGNLNQGT